ncbi:MAG: RagB/SusD family nutrient uptake outer membrane protein [Dysgonamonadaceae bacterium]|jgi:hypothetical protein|nr:RagB/SusD family nutrient uptake outer membrane protein [Dysgonamonadaceae bacterium]
MKKTILYSSLIAVALYFAACTEVLDTAPYDALATESMWKTEESVDQGVAGVYAALRKWGPFAGSFPGYTGDDDYGSTWAFDVWGVTGQPRDNQAMFQGNITPGSDIFNETWKRVYEGVHRANNAIANIPGSLVPDAKKARLIAEAKFLRAYFYLRLNELYGRDGLGVPLYLEPIDVDECTQGQSPEADVWTQIIQDLTDAINDPNFPDKDNTGRASKGAAYALRGKAYLLQGAKYGNNGAVTANADLLRKAVADFDKVDDCGFGLFTGDYKALFTEANESSNEMIFRISHTADKGYGHYAQKLCGSRYVYSGTTNGWNNFEVSPYIVDLYEKVENGVASPFDWESVDADFAGWNTLTPADRAVFFLRDTLDNQGNLIKNSGDGKGLSVTIQSNVQKLLNAAGSTKGKYKAYGNEARILKAYANRDPRLAANVITPYAGIVGGYGYSKAGEALEVFYRWPVQSGNQTPDKTKNNDLATDDANNFVYFHRKFVVEGADLPRREDVPIDEPLIRYADVLLLWAEALVELDDLQGAKAKVKAVRDRVSIPTPDANFAAKDAARNYVRDERRREFVNEGVNFFDEMRWRTWKQTKFKGGADGKSETIWGANMFSYTWAGDHLYVWPVPRTETEKNLNLTKTPGWSY